MSVSSHNAINASFNHDNEDKEVKLPISSRISFTLDEKLQARLIEYKRLNPCKLELKSGTLTIDQITTEYKTLCEMIDDEEPLVLRTSKPKNANINQNSLVIEDRTLLEEYKAALMNAMQAHLHERCSDKKATQLAAEQEQQKSKAKTTLMWIYFSTLMVLEFLPMIIGNLMYATESLEALIPYLPFVVPHPILLAVGIGCVFNSVFGAICFVGPRLLEALGIKYQQKEQALAKAYRDQVSAASKINEILLGHNDISSAEYKSYQELALCINDDIKKLKHHYPTYNERTSSKLFTMFMSAFIGIQALSSSLYLASALVGLIIGSTLSTIALISVMPWTILLVSIPFTLAFFKVAQKLRINSAGSALDPEVGQHHMAKDAVDNFKCEDTKFEAIYNAKVKNETNEKLAKLAPLNFTTHVQAKVIRRLRDKVSDSTQVIQEHKERLTEKDAIIDDQKQEIMKLRAETATQFTLYRKLTSKSPTQMDAISLSETPKASLAGTQ